MSVFSIGQISAADSAVRLRATLGALIQAAPGAAQTRGGMLDSGGAVTRTSGMGIAISPFRLFLQGAAGGQFGYVVVSDAQALATIDDGSASARTDLVCVQVRDNPFDASGQTDTQLVIVKGASGGGTPATPAGMVKLAEVAVPASASAGTGGLTTDPVDKRPARCVAVGGVVPVANVTERGALLLYPGLTVFNRTSRALETYDGTMWSDVPSTWTPTWSSGGTAPSLGTGSITGTYKIGGGWCRARMVLTWASSTNGGTMAWRFTLPTDAPAFAGDSVGIVSLRDVSTSATYARQAFAETATKILVYGGSEGSGGSERANATTPFTWANGDVLVATLNYPIGS